MTVTLIGSGNLATNLGHALKDAGVEILQIYSHTLTNAKRLADELGVEAFCQQIGEINTESDVYIVAVKDDVLTGVMDETLRHLPDRLIVHTAGSMPMMGSGVFYPMQTFSRQRIVSFAHIPIFLETQRKEDMLTLRRLAERLTDSVYELSSDDRRWLHIAAVFSCNFANHMARHVCLRHTASPSASCFRLWTKPSPNSTNFRLVRRRQDRHDEVTRA